MCVAGGSLAKTTQQAAKLLTPSVLRRMAATHQIEPSKALGQNFMIDANAIRRIVRLADIGPGEQVVEVGAGLGSLTLGLAGVAGQVTAIEIDKKLIAALRESVGDAPGVTVVQADAMRMDFNALTTGRTHHMVSNLPYNIATPLIAKLLEEATDLTDFLFVVQKEAGERLAAGPGSRVYGAVSVLVKFHCEAKLLGRVPRSVFWPKPKVESVVVSMKRRPSAVEVDFAELMKVTRAAFSQRRKSIRNPLSDGLGITTDAAEKALKAAGVNPAARAESLSLADFARIAGRLG